jgi:hypothetical protein
MQLQDLAFPDSGRSLQAGPSDDSIISDDSSSTSPPFNHVGSYITGVALILLCALFWCISSVRSGLATRGGEDANATAEPLPSQRDEERTGADAIQSTLLVQRKHAILELFRTSQVTMVRDDGVYLVNSTQKKFNERAKLTNILDPFRKL